MQNAEAAAEQTPEDEADGEVDRDAGSRDLVALRLLVERKLAYIANVLLAVECGDHHHPTFVTIGSLKGDGLLSAEQARTLSHVLTVSKQDLSQHDSEDVQAFLDDAHRVVASMRASVFRRFVQRELRERGWRQDRGEIALPALASRWERDERCIVIRPTFDLGGSKIRAAAAVRDLVEWTGCADRRLVVVPNQSPVASTDDIASPAVMQLQDFLRTIAVPP